MLSGMWVKELFYMLTVTFSMLARSGNFSANARRFMEYEAGAPGGVGGLV